MNESVSRKSDMGEGTALTLIRQDDGDIIIQVHPQDHALARHSIEFCTSGSYSYNTMLALARLFEAMKKDQIEWPQKLPNN